MDAHAERENIPDRAYIADVRIPHSQQVHSLIRSH